MGRARPSLQELIQRRENAGFVGRRRELDAFRDNFGLPPEEGRHHFVFHVHGHAGVGKTWLVRRLEQVARQEYGALTARVDETVGSVPEAMAAISAQFHRQGKEFTAFDRRLATYRQRRHEAESAPDPAERPGPSTGSMVAARTGLAGLGLVPGVGALAGAVDPVPLAEGTDRLRAALSSRFRDHKDVQLVLDPVEALTPLLVRELSEAAAAVPWLVLFFDTYERVGALLDPWLHTLLTSERLGRLPANTVLVLAGQTRLDPGRWGELADVVAELPLEPFTDAEARHLLTAKGITEEPVVREVLRLSGRLPVLVSTLAENPGTSGDLDDPSATAVERFLKWEPDPVRRAAALAGALPRRLNEDVFRAAVGEEAAGAGLFGWLRALPFVGGRTGSARYHDVVRAPMLRLQRTTSPQRWSEAHTRLAETFAGWRETAAGGLDPRDGWKLDAWSGPRLEEWYHLLCARPSAALPGALRDGIDACDAGPAVARRWAATLAEAGEDADSDEVRAWGRRLEGALRDERRRGIEAMGLLLARAGLDTAGRAARTWSGLAPPVGRGERRGAGGLPPSDRAGPRRRAGALRMRRDPPADRGLHRGDGRAGPRGRAGAGRHLGPAGARGDLPPGGPVRGGAGPARPGDRGRSGGPCGAGQPRPDQGGARPAPGGPGGPGPGHRTERRLHLGPGPAGPCPQRPGRHGGRAGRSGPGGGARPGHPRNTGRTR